MFAPSKTRTFMPLALIAAVAMTCLQGAAFAGEVPMESNGRTELVSTAGLNLASPADLARLDQRIETAARRVCAPDNYRDLKALAGRPACQKAAIESAAGKRQALVARAQAEQLASSTNAAPAIN